MAKKKKEPINLLPQEEFAASTVGRILTWLLSSFRMIVIATEMVVMGAFLSRFWLDARNTDLNDEIKQKSAVIVAYKEIEKSFRADQTKLKLVGQLTAGVTENAQIDEAIQSLPGDIILTNLSFEGPTAQIAGLAQSEQSIAQLLVNLNSQKSFKAPSLSQLTSNKDGNGLNFSIKTGGQQ